MATKLASELKTRLECVVSDIKSFLLSAKNIKHLVMTLGSYFDEIVIGIIDPSIEWHLNDNRLRGTKSDTVLPYIQILAIEVDSFSGFKQSYPTFYPTNVD